MYESKHLSRLAEDVLSVAVRPAPTATTLQHRSPSFPRAPRLHLPKATRLLTASILRPRLSPPHRRSARRDARGTSRTSADSPRISYGLWSP